LTLLNDWLSSTFMQRMGGLLLSLTIRFWMRTLDYRLYYYDSSVDPSHSTFRGPVIFLLWHEYLMIPFHLRSRTRLAIVASRHRDAEWLSQMATMNGFQVFRGSSGRGGTSAIKAIMNETKSSGFVITPDGPRGPRRTVAAGAIFLSSKLQIPLIPVGFGFDRPWRNRRSWDQFPFALPGTRTRIILGPRIQIPEDANRDELEVYRQSVERSLNCITETAEQWAVLNCPCTGSQPSAKLPIYAARYTTS
jgi:lysophospholipid acyltransferase (LPLAT)-like uncharacterized protein